MASRQQAKIIAQAAAKYRIPARTLWGVYGTETNFGQNKNTSSAGAVGPFQFLPGTAKSLGIDPYNFKQAAFGAAKYLSQFKGRGLAGMLSAYNAGPGGSIQPQYVKSVRQNAQTFPLGSQGGAGAIQSDSQPLSVLLRQSAPQQALQPPDMTSVNMLTQSLQRPAPPPVSGLAQPSFSAQAPMPQGAQPLPSVGAPAPQGPTLDDQLQAVSQIVGVQPTQPTTDVLALGGGNAASGATSPDAPNSVSDMLHVAKAVSNRKLPYQWGGGHGSSPAKIGTPVDCSGYVSQILGVKPRVSGDFEHYGDAGRGKAVTVYANGGHVLVSIQGRWFATSSSNPGGGAGEIQAPSRQYLAKFTVRHPRGL